MSGWPDRASGPIAGMPERPKGADCKSAGVSLRRFESFSRHGSKRLYKFIAPLAQSVERFHGKEEVSGSNPEGGSATQPARWC